MVSFIMKVNVNVNVVETIGNGLMANVLLFVSKTVFFPQFFLIHIAK